MKTLSEITIAALTGEFGGTMLTDPESGSRGSFSGYGPLEQYLPDLAEGGYVLDLTPLRDHPQIYSWAVRAPMARGTLDDESIDRLSDAAREAAGSMAPFMGGAFQSLAAMAATSTGEPFDGSAGPFDYVSSAYRARWWGSRGARIGKRVGRTIQWSDGTEQAF